MLVLKHYFLSEIERFQKERTVLSVMNDLTEEQVLAMDDRELLEIYNECIKEKLITG
ncbi:hypothetical protein [Bacillus methanolicus]|uniref:Fur-regulated basic protein FbpA n=1 Tax=Bacillus methanolicus (strain MGA3 / ATCC 53907) TaxID=796606 RepID=I3E3K9_BACMM|nr:hypothetical protein [Bacillus methanolicus]AIE58845.1 hypothetical protein BMMGA3_01875 [Bacillus methanolicus MGA3]EIJ81080.1 hypothetical protein MGA3_12355 [Bacillus methanolicus MGA3]